MLCKDILILYNIKRGREQWPAVTYRPQMHKLIFFMFRILRRFHFFLFFSSLKLSYDLMVLSTDGHIHLQSCCTVERLSVAPNENANFEF